MTAEYKISTPVDWQRGDRCLIDPTLSYEKANELFPIGYETLSDIPSKKDYMRFTAQPNLVNRVKKSNELKKQPTPQPISSKVKQDIEPIRSSSSSSNHYETPHETRKQISLSPSSQPASASSNKTNPKSQDANFEDKFEYLENPSKKKSPKTKVIVCNCC